MGLLQKEQDEAKGVTQNVFKNLIGVIKDNIKNITSNKPGRSGAIITRASEEASRITGKNITPQNYAQETKNLPIETKNIIKEQTSNKLASDLKSIFSTTKNVVSAIGTGLTSPELKETRKESWTKGVLQTGAALESTVSKGLSAVGLKKYSEDLRKLAENDLESVKSFQKATGATIEDNGKFIEKIQDPNFIAEGFTQSLPNMLFSIGVAAPAAVVGAPALVTGALLFGSAASLEGGFAYNEAKQQGATEEEATKAASITWYC